MAEIIVCSLSTGLSLFLLYFAKGFPKSIKPNVPSASFFPTIIGVILLGLSLFNLIHALIRIKKAKSAGYEKQSVEKGKVFQILEIVLLMFLYAFLWKYHIGHFLLNSIVVFALICVLLGDDVSWQKSVVFSTGLVVFVYVLFTFLLRVRLW
ncbi:MAG: tripartite tricarboxylate transporter TctB family protein [Sphaerochaetaceae bacterium]